MQFNPCHPVPESRDRKPSRQQLNVQLSSAVPADLMGKGWVRATWADDAGEPLGSRYDVVPTQRIPVGPWVADPSQASFPALVPSMHGLSRPHVPGVKRVRSLFIVGPGPMGLALGWSMATTTRRLGIPCRIVVLGRRVFGHASDPAVAVVRNQGILHRGGSLWACTAPNTARAIRCGAELLSRLAPCACRNTGHAFGILRDGAPATGPEYVEACRSLGGCHEDFGLVSLKTATRMLPLPASTESVLRIPETTVDIALLGQELHSVAASAGCRFVPADVVSIRRESDRVSALVLDDGAGMPVEEGDAVVLTAGARNLALASTAEVAFPGLRHFASALVALKNNEARLPLALCFFGGATVVPHGECLVLGNARRVPIEGPVLTDGAVSKELIERVCQDVHEDLGLACVPNNSWVATKVEATETERCQDFALIRASGLAGLFAAIPGKMSSCVLAANVFAAQLVRSWIENPSQSIWELNSHTVGVDHVAATDGCSKNVLVG